MLFAGFDTRFFTKSGTATFEQIISYSQTDLDALVASILNFTNTTATGPNVETPTSSSRSSRPIR